MTTSVALILPVGHVGGAERWALQQLDATEDLRVSALLLADGPLAEDLERRGVQVEVLPTGPRPTDLLRAVLQVRAWVTAVGPEVVWANGVKAAVAGLPAARLARVPGVWVKHDFSYDARLAPALGRLAAQVVATSAAVGAAVRRPVTVIPPPLAGPPPIPASRADAVWTSRLGSDLVHPVAVTVGRLVAYKGVDTAVRALAADEAAAWRLVVVGEDDPADPGERARLEALAAEWGVAERVRFVGSVPDVGRDLGVFDAALVLTRSDDAGFGREGYSMVALEALRAGVPVIGSADSPELARMAAVAGSVVDPTAPGEVAAALARLGRPDEARRARARSGVSDHPDASATAAALVSVLRSAAGRGRA